MTMGLIASQCQGLREEKLGAILFNDTNLFPCDSSNLVGGENSTRWGSSVITVNEGSSPLMVYETERKPYIILDGLLITIRGGYCLKEKFIDIGRQCRIEKGPIGFLTTIKLFSVKKYTKLIVKDGEGYSYSTYFAPNCSFREQQPAEPIPQPSLPLRRYMKGHHRVNITFAAFFNKSKPLASIHLFNIGKRICWWTKNGLFRGNKKFCQLTPENEKGERWFTGIFDRRKEDISVFRWWINLNSFLSVVVDWTKTGNAPEDAVCLSRKVEGGNT